MADPGKLSEERARLFRDHPLPEVPLDRWWTTSST